MEAPGYSVEDEDAVATIRSLLTEIGPVEWWEVTLETTAKRVKATAIFLDETDARDAVSQLNGKELPFHDNGKLTVNIVYSAKVRVRSDLYNAVVSRVNTQAPAWNERHVLFRAYPSSRILRVEGESATEVAGCKAVIESIMEGVAVKDGQAILWDSSLKHDGLLWGLIKQQQQELEVIVVRDKKKQVLRLFGTEKKCIEAQRQLADLFRTQTSASSTHPIYLDRVTLHWACSGGFKEISSRLGTEKVRFDIVSKKIVVSGSLVDYDLALALVNGRELTDRLRSKTVPGTTAEEDCSVCWTTADAPVRTACDHIYCQDCFENSCKAPSPSGSDFALICHGDQDNCKRAISLQDLHEHLSSTIFEEVLDRSFASYVQRHPDELRFCPTPDCGYVYRVTTSASTHTCPNCLQATCSACHGAHVNMTCAEYKDIQSGRYAAFQKLKAEIGIKDCPKCKTLIEKLAGCNHITCVGCNIHICWVCLKTFPSGGPVYEHMGSIHGGIIDWE